jgi:hypothetical protein
MPSTSSYAHWRSKRTLLFPTIGVHDDVTTLFESNLLKHIHDELSTNGSQMMRLMNGLKTLLESEQEGDVMARANKEMCSLGYKCEHQSSVEIGRVAAKNNEYNEYNENIFITFNILVIN